MMINGSEMIEYKKGNIFDGTEDIIVHGCNCKCVMGAGIARQVQRLYPMAHLADVKTLWGDKSKLGNYSSARGDDGKLIINAYTQFNYTRHDVDVDYDAIREVMRKINNDFPEPYSIAMPKIGCGLAGGDWNIISKILEETFGKRQIVVYYL